MDDIKCSDCSHFCYEGEFDYGDDIYTEVTCEKNHYLEVGFGLPPCSDFSRD